MNKVHNPSMGIGQHDFGMAAFQGAQRSKLSPPAPVKTTLNAGDLVPIYHFEILPTTRVKIDFSFILRQMTLLFPTMDVAYVTFDAFFVPNRITNKSWENVLGCNTAGKWTAKEVELAPLVAPLSKTEYYQVLPQSVADYLGFPTQKPTNAPGLWKGHLSECHDLSIRAYLEIYNNFYRDQNYQDPVPYSKLNVLNGFFEPVGTFIGLNNYAVSGSKTILVGSDGSPGNIKISAAGPNRYLVEGAGSVSKAIGEGFVDSVVNDVSDSSLLQFKTSFQANRQILKVNKLHDYFTSCLPDTQKGQAVTVPLVSANGSEIANLPVTFSFATNFNNFDSSSGNPWKVLSPNGSTISNDWRNLVTLPNIGASNSNNVAFSNQNGITPIPNSEIKAMNLAGVVDLSQSSISVNDLRYASALQRYYEVLARGGSRYEEYLYSIFGLELDNALNSIPTHIGRFTKQLGIYQTASTSEQANSPIGTLGGFGMTSEQAGFPEFTAPEHGYIMIMCAIRQKNTYPSLLSRDKFRRRPNDFYVPQLANISEQPVFTRELNPFDINGNVLGYQEAWAEYRHHNGIISGYMRDGIDENLGYMTYTDLFDSGITTINDDWLKSNAAEVIDKTLTVEHTKAPQFFFDGVFNLHLDIPLPTFSVPGADII